jgi:hypothetical protein
MPRLGNNSTTAAAANSANSRNGQLKFHWSFSYEFDWPNNTPAYGSQGAVARGRSGADELGALLDKALAFAG